MTNLLKRLICILSLGLVAIAPLIVGVNACTYTWGETEIPECLREE